MTEFNIAGVGCSSNADTWNYLTTFKEGNSHNPGKQARKTALIAGLIMLVCFIAFTLITGILLSE